MSWQRLLYIFCVAFVEATLLAMVLAVLGGEAWGLLLLVVLAGGLANWFVLRWLPEERRQVALLAAGLLCAAWATKTATLGDSGLFTGWGRLFDLLVSIGRIDSGLAYVTLLVSAVGFWRGTRMHLDDSALLRQWFVRASFALILIVGLGTIGDTNARHIARITVELMLFFGVGLIALALSVAAEHADQRLRKLDWRGLGVVTLNVVLLLVVVLLVAGLFGEQAGAAAQVIVNVLLGIALIILTPFLLVISAVMSWLISVIRIQPAVDLLAQSEGLLALGQEQSQGQLTQAPLWVQVIMSIIAWIIPFLIVVGLFFLARRKLRRRDNTGEERESIFSLSGFAADLRGLFANLRRNPHQEGLRDALARLRGDDPVSRIRRSYIRLLLHGAEHERPRVPSATPREYAPLAAAEQPGAGSAVEALTRTYERARYYPEATSEADAQTAERAWRAFERPE